MRHQHRSTRFALLLALLFGIAACSANNGAPALPTITPVAEKTSPDLAPTETAKPSTPTPESTATEAPSPTPAPALWIADYVPQAIAVHMTGQLGETVTFSDDAVSADLRLDVGGEPPTAQWVYTLVAPFPTIADGVTTADLQAAWQGNLAAGPFAGIPLMMSPDSYEVLARIWGEAPEGAVQTVSSEALLQTAWDQQPSWAIVPFERLTPKWKVLQIEEQSPLDKSFDPAAYPLTVPFGLTGEMPGSLTPSTSILTNRDPAKMTDIMLTGVTALVRGTALTMERTSMTYPGEDIAPLTTSVDFMHVNNEIPFTPDCPSPELYPEFLVFCSDVRYLELLEYIGTDIVEVSGDHFGDHGPEGTLFTLDLYDEVGLPYYGGGRDLADGRKPLLIEHNGNRIAILGCNAKGSEYYAPANENTPGAVPCDFEWLETEIARLSTEGYLVIMTFQHIEYYSFEAQPDLVRDFGRIAEAGAAIVSGSQSHQAHGFAFQNEAFIHYGLGNLFFDQYLFCENANCDYGFMDRHVIYDGRHISTEVIPIRFIDMARPRLMTAEEKAWFMDLIFEASGWTTE